MFESRKSEEEFQAIKTATIREFEDEIERLRTQRTEDRRESLDRVKRFHGYLHEAIEEAELDADIFGKLERYHREEGERLQERLDQLHADPLLKGDVEFRNRAYRAQTAELARLRSFPQIQQAGCIDAYAIADGEVLEGLQHTGGYQHPAPGVKLNPYANSVDPRWLPLKAVHTGTGSGMAAYGKPLPVYGVFHFSLVPQQDTGILTATAEIFYYGFWFVKANDGCWDNKDASASLDVWFRWQQGAHVSGWKKQPFMWVTGDNIHFYRFHQGETDAYSYQIGPLLGGHTTWITLVVELQVDARGGGSRAEINYADGTGHSIWPMSVLVG